MENGLQLMDSPGLRLFISGGPVMFVLLGLSVLMVAIIFVKVWQFTHSDLRDTGFVDEVLGAVAAGESLKASVLLGQSRHPVARVFERVLAVLAEGRSREDTEAAVRRAGTAEIQRLESSLRGLELIATVAPLLGLLGTVLGMIEAFAEVERFGSSVDPAILAGGIWQALLTTAYGLILAIPALSVAYLLQNRADEVREMMSQSVTELLLTEPSSNRDEAVP